MPTSPDAASPTAADEGAELPLVPDELPELCAVYRRFTISFSRCPELPPASKPAFYAEYTKFSERWRDPSALSAEDVKWIAWECRNEVTQIEHQADYLKCPL